MFLPNKRNYSGYTASGEQRSHGAFLILMQQDYGTPQADELPATQLHAVIRRVTLKQFGHFMMGNTSVANHPVTLSGAFGGDGLPCHVPTEIMLTGQRIPLEVYWAWATGTSEHTNYDVIRRWATANYADLKQPIRNQQRPSYQRSRNEYVRRYRFYHPTGRNVVTAEYIYCDTHSHLWLQQPTINPDLPLYHAEATNYAHLAQGVPIPYGQCEACERIANASGIVINDPLAAQAIADQQTIITKQHYT